MNETQIDDLFSRAVHAASTGTGQLRPEEIEAVVAELQSGKASVLLMRTLGYACGPKYKSVLEPFLNGPSPVLAATALWVLCNYWGLTSEYIEHVRAMVRRASSDGYEMASPFVMGIAGDFLSTNRCPELLSDLLQVMVSPDSDEDASYLAFAALKRALGYPNLDENDLAEAVSKRIADEVNNGA